MSIYSYNSFFKYKYLMKKEILPTHRAIDHLQDQVVSLGVSNRKEQGGVCGRLDLQRDFLRLTNSVMILCCIKNTCRLTEGAVFCFCC